MGCGRWASRDRQLRSRRVLGADSATTLQSGRFGNCMFQSLDRIRNRKEDVMPSYTGLGAGSVDMPMFKSELPLSRCYPSKHERLANSSVSAW